MLIFFFISFSLAICILSELLLEKIDGLKTNPKFVRNRANMIIFSLFITYNFDLSNSFKASITHLTERCKYVFKITVSTPKENCSQLYVFLFENIE